MNRVFITSRTVLFGDCDPAGVIFTPRLSYYVVEAMVAFSSECFGIPAERFVMDLGMLPPTRSMTVEFLGRMTWDDLVTIRVWIKNLGRTSITFAFDGEVRGEKVFQATLLQVWIDRDTKNPVAIPSSVVEILSPYVER